MSDFATARNLMVESQIAARGIMRKDLLDAMRVVPREAFVAREFADSAYQDSPLPIEAGQTISQPYIVALMIEAASVAAGDHILEIGAGSGYLAAILAQMGANVSAVERHPELARSATGRLRQLGYDSAEIRCADGSYGWPERGPFDAIIVSASGSHVPDILIGQLVTGGRLIMPIGAPNETQHLIKVSRTAGDPPRREDLGPVRFVPLIGAHAWEESGNDTTGSTPGR